MYVHVVLFKWKENTDPKEVHKILQDIRALKDKIPGIVGMRCGENFSDYSDGYTHALVVSFSDMESIGLYKNDPAHLKIVAAIKKIEEHSMGVDFEDHNK